MVFATWSTPVHDRELANGIQDVYFRFPDNMIHLPITSFSVERHFVDYSDRESMQRVAHMITECNNQHDCLQD